MTIGTLNYNSVMVEKTALKLRRIKIKIERTSEEPDGAEDLGQSHHIYGQKENLENIRNKS